MASLTGDGADDQDSVYRAVINRDPGAAVIVPPRSTAVPSETAETEPTRQQAHELDRGHHTWGLIIRRSGICGERQMCSRLQKADHGG